MISLIALDCIFYSIPSYNIGMAIWHKSVQKKLRSFHFTFTNYPLTIQTNITARTHYLYRNSRKMIFYDKLSGRLIMIWNIMKDWTSNWIRLCVWMISLEKESKEFSIMRMYGHSNFNHFLLHTNASSTVWKYQSFLIVCIVNWLVEPKWTSFPDICHSKKVNYSILITMFLGFALIYFYSLLILAIYTVSTKPIMENKL